MLFKLHYLSFPISCKSKIPNFDYTIIITCCDHMRILNVKYFINCAFMNFRYMSFNLTITYHIQTSVCTSCIQYVSLGVEIYTSDRISLVCQHKCLGCLLFIISEYSNLTSDLASDQHILSR